MKKYNAGDVITRLMESGDPQEILDKKHPEDFIYVWDRDDRYKLCKENPEIFRTGVEYAVKNNRKDIIEELPSSDNEVSCVFYTPQDVDNLLRELPINASSEVADFAISMIFCYPEYQYSHEASHRIVKVICKNLVLMDVLEERGIVPDILENHNLTLDIEDIGSLLDLEWYYPSLGLLEGYFDEMDCVHLMGAIGNICCVEESNKEFEFYLHKIPITCLNEAREYPESEFKDLVLKELQNRYIPKEKFPEYGKEEPELEELPIKTPHGIISSISKMSYNQLKKYVNRLKEYERSEGQTYTQYV